MCCFSGTVESVSDTNIFARFAAKGEQFLAYSMKLRTDKELAMILPIPVPSKTKDDAVKFIDLEGYPDFFKDITNRGFPKPTAARALAMIKSQKDLTDRAPIHH